MRRRDFIRLLGGAAAWPVAAHAQQVKQRRVAILTALDDAQTKIRVAPLLEELEQLGWVDGRNVRIDLRAAGGNIDTVRKYGQEMLASTPDVLVGFGTAMGSGCTSGHGVCGLSRGSVRSLAAVMTFMLTGAITAWIAGGA